MAIIPKNGLKGSKKERSNAEPKRLTRSTLQMGHPIANNPIMAPPYTLLSCLFSFLFLIPIK